MGVPYDYFQGIPLISRMQLQHTDDSVSFRGNNVNRYLVDQLMQPSTSWQCAKALWYVKNAEPTEPKFHPDRKSKPLAGLPFAG